MEYSYLGRNWLQWTEIIAVLVGTVFLAPLAIVGIAISGGLLVSLGGLMGIAGLWVLTIPRLPTIRQQLGLRLVGTLLVSPGVVVATVFLRFEMRTGRDASDALFAFFVCVLPIAIFLHRLYVAWRPRRIHAGDLEASTRRSTL